MFVTRGKSCIKCSSRSYKRTLTDNGAMSKIIRFGSCCIQFLLFEFIKNKEFIDEMIDGEVQLAEPISEKI